MAGVTRSVSSRPPSVEESELRRGPWTIEEDTLLIHYIAGHGEGQWNILAKQAGLKRTGKSCRLRWLNYLKPDVKRGNLTLQEQLLILELHSKWGNRWSKIAQQLPGRTDNEIKNYWRTRVQKQARQHKIQSNNKRFLEAIRHWSVLQAIEETSNSCNFPLSLHSMSLPNSSEILPHHRQSSHDGGAPGLVVSANPQQHWPEFPQHPLSPCGEFGNVQLEETWSLDMVEQKQDPFSALEAWDVAEYDAQMAAADWVLEDGMVESLWNLDDLI